MNDDRKLSTPTINRRGRVAPHVSGGERDNLFFAAVETTRMPMVVTDPNQNDNPIVFCNAAFERMTGYAQSEIIGRNCRFLQGPDTDRTTIAQVSQSIGEREEIAVEVLNYRKNGSSFWNALFISPVFDDDGQIIYHFGSQLDVSRRREAEEALRQAQKMEAVGKLTGGIAHDFNNLLQVISGYAEILERKLDPADRAASRAVEAITKAAGRGATLTQQLLAFARKAELRERTLNLNTLIEDFRSIVERTVGEDIQIRMELDADLWNCRVDPVQAEMAILNIVTNARDAIGEDGQVTLRTFNRVVAPDEALADRVAPGEYAGLEVRDNGAGIEPDVLDKIFDPFFSTKDVGKGTGLGLAMVYGFLRQSGGGVTAENVEGGGAAFTLYLPHAGGRVETPAIHATGNGGGDERILLVEDQEEVAMLAAAMLEDQGYAVTHKPDARSALAELERDGGYRLVLSDIVMPGGMNGVALANEVRRRMPRMPILLATGYSSQALDEAAQAFELITKPFRASELSQKVRMVLDGPDGVT